MEGQPFMHRLLLTLVLCAASSTAMAGRPLVTEDAAILEPRSCELEAFAVRATESGSPATQGGSAQVGCGMGWRSQVALGTAQLRSDGQTERSYTLGGKTALHELSNGAALTLAWGITGVKPPAGRFEHETTYLNGVMSHPLSAQTKVHANLGWSASRSADASTTNWALALEHALGAGVDLMAETFATDRDRSPWLQAAVRWAVRPEQLFLDASWGFQTRSSRPKALTLGLKLAF